MMLKKKKKVQNQHIEEFFFCTFSYSANCLKNFDN